MIRPLLAFLFLNAAILANAQTMGKTVMASGGEPLSNGSVQLNVTLGEPVVGLISNELTIDQGFWAGSLFVEPITVVEELAGISVYPNPMIDELNIQTNNNPVFGITMFAVNGKMALKQKVESTQVEHKIEVSHLAKGMYILRLSIENGEEKLFKVIKR